MEGKTFLVTFYRFSGYGQLHRQWYKAFEGEFQNNQEHGHGITYMFHEEIETSIKIEEGNYSNGKLSN